MRYYLKGTIGTSPTLKDYDVANVAQTNATKVKELDAVNTNRETIPRDYDSRINYTTNSVRKHVAANVAQTNATRSYVVNAAHTYTADVARAGEVASSILPMLCSQIMQRCATW